MSYPAPAGAGGMAGVEAFAAQHRLQLLGGAAGAVALYALMRKRSAAAAASTATPAADPTTAAAANVQSYAANGGGGVYSSGVTDFYDAIQPTLEQIQGQLDKINSTVPGTTTTTPPAVVVTPVPAQPVLKQTPPSPAPTPAAPALQRYVVKPGDNLSTIAAAFGLPGGRSTGWQALYAANSGVIGGNPNLIRPGQTLTIPR